MIIFSSVNANESQSYSSLAGLQINGNGVIRLPSEEPVAQLPYVRSPFGSMKTGEIQPSSVLVGSSPAFNSHRSEGGAGVEQLPKLMGTGSLGGTLTMTDAQNVVDTATGKVGASDNQVRNRSYQLVRAAAENVANTHAEMNVFAVMPEDLSNRWMQPIRPDVIKLSQMLSRCRLYRR